MKKTRQFALLFAAVLTKWLIFILLYSVIT